MELREEELKLADEVNSAKEMACDLYLVNFLSFY